MASWMTYATVVALLVGAAAWALERATRATGLPVRWIWAGALAASLAIPLVDLLPRAEPLSAARSAAVAAAGPAESAISEVADISSSGGGVGRPSLRWANLRLPATPPIPSELDALVLSGWLLLSLVFTVGLLRAFRALARARRGWRNERMDGRDVLVSDALGPALVGVLRPVIVMPRWALELSPEQRELMLCHEEEHRRAGDAPLLLAGVLFLVLLPWNAPLWWQLRQLRVAVEVDCDRRVLRRTGELRRYARLLLEIGRRRTSLPFSIALAEPASFLERRIRTMTTRPKPRYVRSLGLVLTSGLLIAAAGGIEQPSPVEPASAAVEVAQIRGRVTDAATGAPLADARLYLVGTNLAAISASTGAYVLGNVPAGTHEMRVERVGYALASRQIALTDGAVLETDFALTVSEERIVTPEPAPTPLGPGTRINGRVVDIAGNPVAEVQVYLVDANLGAITRQNGQYLLLNVPPGTYTLRAQRRGVSTEDREITVARGESLQVDFQVTVQPPLDALDAPLRNDPRPIIYIDGVRVSPPPGGGVDLGQVVRPEDIERVEVIKGTAAVNLYGSDAANGVILIYKKKPQLEGAADATRRTPMDPQTVE